MADVTTFFGVRKRGRNGLLFKWSFILFNLLMCYVLYYLWPDISSWLAAVWIGVALILGFLTYLTRVNEVKIVLR